MDNTKNDHYYISKVQEDLLFIVEHMRDVDLEELASYETKVEKTKDGKIVSFKIMVLLGRDEKNKQRFKCKTWHPDKGMRHTFARNYYIQTFLILWCFYS